MGASAERQAKTARARDYAPHGRGKARVSVARRQTPPVGPARWPDASAATDRSIAGLVMLAGRLFSRTLHSRLGPHGVAPGQLAVLRLLWEEDGLTQAALARKARVEQPTMARTLDRMARDGLIERVPSKEDRRAFNVRLTRHGKQLRQGVRAEAGALDTLAVSAMAKGDRDKLTTLLRRLVDSLKKAASG
jgi:DNA-binding MarR family transcriptional regulator